MTDVTIFEQSGSVLSKKNYHNILLNLVIIMRKL